MGLVGIFVAVAGWRAGQNLSSDAVGMALGLVLGVMAGIPAALIATSGNRRGDDYHGRTERPQPPPRIEHHTHHNHLHVHGPAQRQQRQLEDRRHEQLRRRLLVYGWPPARAFTEPPRKHAGPRLVTAYGRSQSIRAWATEIGCSYGTMHYWVRRLGDGEAAVERAQLGTGGAK